MTDDRIEGSSAYQTLKSTFIMGASSVINIVLGILRNKIVALLLRPSGMGLMGVYQSISNLAVTISGLGINESGARQVALAFRSGNDESISRTWTTLRRVALITGLVGTVVMVISGQWVGFFTFHDAEHTTDIILLSLTILFGTISGGQMALIQGARRIPDLAKINMLGPLWGTLFSLPIIYFLGMRGIVSYLIIMAATNVVASWWYSRKIRIVETRATWRDLFSDSSPLVKLGVALMIGNLIGFGTAFLLRILLIRYLNLDAAGEFQAASILSTVYVGIIFKAMATDFYPRLSAASDDDRQCGALINEQIQAGIFLAVPGVLATLTLAPFVLTLLYSAKFLPAVEVLRWQVLGVLLQVVTWPMGYILRAKAAGRLFILTELFGSVCYLAATWMGLRVVGLPGIGIAFLVYNLVYFILIFQIVHTKYKFSFIAKNIRLLILAVSVTGVAFLSVYIFPKFHIAINSAITIAAMVYSYKELDFSRWIRKFVGVVKR